MRMRKLVLDLSLAQILPEKINKMLSLNSLGFIDVLSTVDPNSFGLVLFRNAIFELTKSCLVIFGI